MNLIPTRLQFRSAALVLALPFVFVSCQGVTDGRVGGPGKPAEEIIPGGHRAVAVAIGLNRVDPAHYANWSGPLRGCENDAADMVNIAKSRYFQTFSLLTTKATRGAVKSTLSKLASELNKGDTLVVSYSGHGSQVEDLNGDEDDNYDETWCLFDGQLVDDELAEIWSKFKPGVRIVVYSDSCHSGSVIKNLNPRDPNTYLYREMPRDVQDLVMRLAENKDLGRNVPGQNVSESKTRATVILISGCLDTQTSMDGTKNGKFTEKLEEVWNQGQFSKSYRKFKEAIAKKLPETQQPNYFVIGADNPAFEKEHPWTP